MQLDLVRITHTPLSIIGKLAIEGIYFCHTLERPLTGSIVCIPEGTYAIEMSWSRDFNREMPHLINVPGRTDIMIHWGNYPHDTLGCILVGETAGVDFVGNSKTAFEALLPKIINGATITITSIGDHNE